MQIDPVEILYQFRRQRGLLGIRSKVPLRDEYMLSLLYTPGVAEPCRRIHKTPELARDLTIKGNAVAILSDGSAAHIKKWAPYGLIPLLESQAVLMRELAGLDAYPFSLDLSGGGSLVETAVTLSGSVSALALDLCEFPEILPRRTEIERASGIPVINLGGEVLSALVMAGLFSLSRKLRKKPTDLQVLLVGYSSATHWLKYSSSCSPFKNLDLVDPERLEQGVGVEILPSIPSGTRPDAVVIGRSEVFSGLAGKIPAECAIFDLDNTGLSPRPNLYDWWGGIGPWFHPALMYPGLLRGVIDCRLRHVPIDFYPEIAREVAGLVAESQIREGQLFPNPLETKVAPTLARKVAQLAKLTGQGHVPSPTTIYDKAFERLYSGALPSSSAGLKTSRRRKSSAALARESLALHEKYRGAIEVFSKLPVRDEFMLQILSPPGVLAVSRKIAEQPVSVFEYSSKSNLVAVITDGSAVLGLGDIGPVAGLPVMAGKSLLLKTLAGVESIPLCLGSNDPDVIIRTVHTLLPVLGGVNLEDISAPRCFEIEEELRRISNIPIFHDDQHGTATVVLAGLINACRCAGREFRDLTVVVNGAGASAIAVSKLLLRAGVGDLILCDTKGAIYEGRTEGMNRIKEAMSVETNRSRRTGSLAEVIRRTSAFIGLSVPGSVTAEMIQSMEPDPIIFALANPTPEIMPAEAAAGGAKVVATGRSDFKNQINNALAFPGIFRGALDVRARTINDEMKIAAAQAIADLVRPHELRPNYIIPHALDARVAPHVAAAVARAALETGQARVIVEPRAVRDNTREYLYGGRLEPVIGEAL